MRGWWLVLLVSLLSAPAMAQKKGARGHKPSAPSAEPAPLPPDARNRIALIEPAAAKGVSRPVLKKAVESIVGDFRSSGIEVVPPTQVTALHLKRRLKVPACADDPACLARVGAFVSAGYVANFSVVPAGKAFAVKLTIVETTTASIVLNVAGLVRTPNESALVAVMSKQVPRAVTALGKRIAETTPAVAPVPEPAALPEAAAVPEPATLPLSPEPKPAMAAAAPAEPALEAPPPAPAVDEPTPTVVDTPQLPVDSPPLPTPLAVSLATPRAEAPVSAVKRSSSGGGVLPWLLIGAGAVGVGVGIGVFGMQARAAANDFRAGKDPDDARDRAKSRALLADLTAGGGALLAAVGGGILLFSSRSETAPTVQASVSVSRTGAVLAVSGSFLP